MRSNLLLKSSGNAGALGFMWINLVQDVGYAVCLAPGPSTGTSLSASHCLAAGAAACPALPCTLLLPPCHHPQTVAMSAQRKESALRSKRLKRDPSLGSLPGSRQISRDPSRASLGGLACRALLHPCQVLWNGNSVAK